MPMRMKKLTHETGATVLFVSHSMESVLEICNRAILIERGRIVNDADPLTISKVYNDMIRKEDELLLKAKESKLRKKDYRALNSISNDYQPLLFRFKTDIDHPRAKHYFYNISIYQESNAISEIAVGSPMDNDIHSLNRIIDGAGQMDWGKSIKHAGSYCRAYQNERGVCCHAPFQLCIPKHLLIGQQILMKVNAVISNVEPVYLEIWINNEYKRIAELTHDSPDFTIQLSNWLINLDGDDQVGLNKNTIEKEQSLHLSGVSDMGNLSNNTDLNNREKNSYNYEYFASQLSIYGSQEVIIKNLDILDESCKSKRIYYMGGSLSFKIDLQARQIIPSFVIVTSILQKDGRPVGQVFCESSKLGLIDFEGETTIYLKYSPLRFGCGEYMVSIGIFKKCDMHTERENEAYCVVDRAVFFKVLQPDDIKKGLGAFAHPVVWQCDKQQYNYDPADHCLF